MKNLTLSVFIKKPMEHVYHYVHDLNNLPNWAFQFVKSISFINNKWRAETSVGPHDFRIEENNNFGILDHWVKPAGGAEIYVPMRVISCNGGSEVLFTLVRTIDMSDERFQNDANFVQRDLETLKTILEEN